MVEPSFLALTSTPSIAPSSLDDTSPESAVWADAPLAIATTMNPTDIPSQECLGRMEDLPMSHSLWEDYCAFQSHVEAGPAMVRGGRAHDNDCNWIQRRAHRESANAA